MDIRKLFLILVSIVCLASIAKAEANHIKFINKSKWSIAQLYLSTASDNHWGPDQLGKEIINTNESFDLQGIPTGKYDLKIIDEDGDECIIDDIKIAGSDSISISDKDLVECEAATVTVDEEAGLDMNEE